MNREAQSKPSILLIEDDPIHVEQVKSLFSNYKLKILDRDMNLSELFNFMSLNLSPQIIIVDLRLGTTKEEEGTKKIIEYIWPLDRSMYFIVFTRIRSIPKSMKSLKRFNPHWVYLRKDLGTNGLILESSLENLKLKVEELIKYSDPRLRIPRYDTYGFINSFVELLKESSPREDIEKQNKLYYNCISPSLDILTSLSNGAFAYSKTGLFSERIGIAVYGSCGRLEIRPQSDIEVCVFYDNNLRQLSEEEKAVIISFWNRVRSLITNNNWKCEEGHEILTDNFLRWENIPDVNSSGYVPVININELLSKDPEIIENQYVRNRILQILLEYKPIFNPELLNTFKLKIISQLTKTNIDELKDSRDLIITSVGFKKVINQFLLDTEPYEVKSFKDIKNIHFRVIHILCTKLAMIGYLLENKTEIIDENDWFNLFSVINEQSVIKLLRFKDYFLKHYNNDLNQEIISNIDIIIHHFLKSMEYLTSNKTNSVPKGMIKIDIINVLKCFSNLFKTFRIQQNKFIPIANATWLCDTEPVETMIHMIESS